MVGPAAACTEVEPRARSRPLAGEDSPAPHSPVAGWPSPPSSPALTLTRVHRSRGAGGPGSEAWPCS